MKAESADQLALLRVQEHDNHIAHLTQLRSRIPLEAELEVVVARIRDFSQIELARHRELEEAKRDLARIEDDVRVVDERIAKDQAREEQNLSAKEIQAIETELASLARRKSELEDMELVIMQAVEDAQQAVDSLSAEHENLALAKEQLLRALEDEQARLDAELAAEMAARAELTAGLPKDLMELYEKQRTRYGVGAAALLHRVSGGSGMELTPTDIDRIRHADADDVVLCPDSSCILVRTNESW